MILLWLCACAHDDDDDGVDDPKKPGVTADIVSSTVYDATSDRDGYLSIPVEVTEDGGIFQVVVTRERGMLSTEYLNGPDGSAILDWEDWYDSSFSLTESFFPTEFATTLNWPVREEDGPLEVGSYEVIISTLDAQGYYAGRENVQVEVLTRAEPNAARGALRVVVAYAEGVRDEPDVVASVEAAVDYWVELYAAVGVTLEPEYSDIAVDAELPDTYEGLPEISAFHDSQDQRTLLMVVGERIAADRWLYGEAGGIPGPYASADHAAVFVSWLANAGSDAEFQEADILLFGETMAHEVGHFVGLFHPVEDGWEYWDALEDTSDCTGMGACEGSLGANLMFPYPVCTGGSAASCLRQDVLSGGQAGVVNRYVGVE
ncbi:MAG: hypothetical protein Q8P41_02500 [Pseudomonadota bacterium]|nr:hypothetical protein [Pseudomonadota bacterium]